MQKKKKKNISKMKIINNIIIGADNGLLYGLVEFNEINHMKKYASHDIYYVRCVRYLMKAMIYPSIPCKKGVCH